jgi:hypothetical protein
MTAKTGHIRVPQFMRVWGSKGDVLGKTEGYR